MDGRDRNLGTVLVTGASGFVGRHVVARLRERSIPVRVLTRRETEWPGGLEVVRADIAAGPLPDQVMRGISTVLHLAGKAHDLAESLRTDGHRAATVQGTANILEAADRAGVDAVVFASSLAVYGSATGGRRDEQSECAPSTHYGRAKLEAERLVLQWGERAGRHAAILRPAMVYGPGCGGNLPRMIRAVESGWFPPLPEVDARRSLVHVGGLVTALLAVAVHPAARGEAFIVADEKDYAPREIYVSILRALDRPIPSWAVPVGLLKAGAVAGDVLGRLAGRRMPLDSHALERLVGSAWFSPAKLARLVGCRSTETLDQVLPAMVAAMRVADGR